MTCACHKDSNKTATYYYLEFVGFTEQKIDTSKLLGETDAGEEWKEQSNPFGLGKNMKIPVGDFFSEIVMSDSGLFIPSEIHDYLKASYKLNRVQITLIRELSCDEFDAEMKYKATKKKIMGAMNAAIEHEKKNAAQPAKVDIPHDSKSELEQLFAQTESGRLHVIAPDADEPEVERPKTQEDFENGDFGDFKFDDEDE